MSKCFLFVEEESSLVRDAWESLFFCDLACETVFLCRRAILLGCSHGTFARLRSVVLTFARGGCGLVLVGRLRNYSAVPLQTRL